MIFALDAEFNGFGGELLSLALVSETGETLYLVVDPLPKKIIPWVRENVIPFLDQSPPNVAAIRSQDSGARARIIGEFLRKSGTMATIITDWWDDVKYLCESLMTGPGTSVSVTPLTTFKVFRGIHVPEAETIGGVNHNAAWDALMLQRWYKKEAEFGRVH